MNNKFTMTLEQFKKSWKRIAVVSSACMLGIVIVDSAFAETNVYRDRDARVNLRVACERLPTFFERRPYGAAVWSSGNGDSLISAVATFRFFRPNGTTVDVRESVRQAPILNNVLVVSDPLSVNSRARDVTSVQYDGLVTGVKFNPRTRRAEVTFYESAFIVPDQIKQASCPPDDLPPEPPPTPY